MRGRYSRQFPIFGDEGQRRLENATVGIAGCGGLGTNAATHLAASGVGTLILADGDVPEESNLNRQFVFREGDQRNKAVLLAEWVRSVNPAAEVRPFPGYIDGDTVKIFGECDIIMDCLDSREARTILNGYALSSGKPLVHGGTEGTGGQVTSVIPGRTPCLECILPPGRAGDPASMSAAAGTAGAVMAAEAVKIITGTGSPLAGRIFFFDLLTGNFRTEDILLRPGCAACSCGKRV